MLPYMIGLRMLQARLRDRLDRARDSLRFLRCRARVHRFEPGATRCSRCDAVRVEHWGGWVVVDG